ncbi:hypothetical protein NQ176_g1745 [Zarea fungicola]|uniref:Uncharacterized protein n=1 Tax=Zarea fungicola TaxID=93591 RepID=A0ACC1NSL6_9HYPO|nr:hypothetical protein NQ176_g1745 [Lecanicillium fungicola]
MFSCFGTDGDEDEREPLLPKYNDDTGRQARLHEKLHTYQMLRAISKGYMPTTDQTIVQLRTLLSSQVINPSETTGLSPSGRALVRTTREWLELFIELLNQKNSKNQIQDFIWYLSSTRVHVDANGAGSAISKGRAHAKASAIVEGLRTIFSLALANNDFRVLVADIGTISKQILRDGAFAVSEVSQEAGKQLDPVANGSGDLATLKATDKKAETKLPKEELKKEVRQVKDNVQGEVSQVSEELYTSFRDHMSEEAQQVLISRLKAAVSSLRQKKDYSEAVSQVAHLLQRCVVIYLSAAGEAADQVEDNVSLNQDAKEAATNFWGFISSFGDEERWDRVSTAFREFIDKNHENKENAEQLAQELITMLQKMLSDPEFLNNFGEKKDEMKGKIKELTNDSALVDDISRIVDTTQSALHSALGDPALQKLTSASLRLAEIGFPGNQAGNPDLFTDFSNVFLPLMLQAVQHIPIPRLEVATPTVDLLLENLILQPGKTIHHSSFLPYNLHLTTKNDLNVTKVRPLASLSAAARGQERQFAGYGANSRGSNDDCLPDAAQVASQLDELKTQTAVLELSEAERIALVQYLSFPEIDARLMNLILAEKKTCEWFLRTPVYTAWQGTSKVAQQRGLLWIKGKPGAGKSVLMKFLLSEERPRVRAGDRLVISFFFNAQGVDLEKSALGLYRSLLSQLFQLSPDVQSALGWLTHHSAQQLLRQGWKLEPLKQGIRESIKRLGDRTLCILVDALDECSGDDIQDMVNFFEEIGAAAADAQKKLQICFSSRHYPNILVNAGLQIVLEAEPGHDNDITLFIKSNLRMGDSPTRRLDALFAMIVHRDTENGGDFRLCLLVLLYAYRPLKPEELWFAIHLAKDLKTSTRWDENVICREDMVRFANDSSKGLAELTRAENIQLIHESVRDFLLHEKSRRTLWPEFWENLAGWGNDILKECCDAQIKNCRNRDHNEYLTNFEKRSNRFITGCPFLEIDQGGVDGGNFASGNDADDDPEKDGLLFELKDKLLTNC